MKDLQPLNGAAKKVAVIGGGPAGMMAALTASKQGHQVHLFEKTDRLGGLLNHCDTVEFKWPLPGLPGLFGPSGAGGFGHRLAYELCS